jgi:sulfite reductase alpha subunit-like flavoprotein
MNERVKAILQTALKLSPDERQELVRTLMENLGTDPAEADQLFTDDGSDAEAPPRPTSDVLAKYLDISSRGD